VIGEGEKDEAPMLANGESIGDGSPPVCDIAVDPLEGTTLTARGFGGALAVVSLSERGTMFDPGPCVYAEKLAGGPEIADLLSLEKPIGEVIRDVAGRKGVDPGLVTFTILDRPRHDDVVREIREAGARIRYISDGDVAGAISAARYGTGVDLLMGVGGTPEGIIAAAALACMGGSIQAKLWPQNDAERQKAIDAGHDLDRVLTTTDLVSGQNIFFCATGITDGDLLRGARYYADSVQTSSIVMRSKSGTIRMVDSVHQLGKLRAYSAVDFDRN